MTQKKRIRNKMTKIRKRKSLFETIFVGECCDICKKAFETGEVFIGKLPEGIWFCVECCEKHKDDKEYEGPLDAWVVNRYGKGMFYSTNPEMGQEVRNDLTDGRR